MKKRIGILRTGCVVGLMGLTACGMGYREGAAAKAEPGSDAHGEAIVAIAREINDECVLGNASERCHALLDELEPEMPRCLQARGCEGALAQALEGEPEEVAAYIGLAGLTGALSGARSDRRR